MAVFTILYYYPPHREFELICIGKFARRTWVNFTQRYGKNRQRCQQNKFTMLYGNYCCIFIKNFPQKFCPCVSELFWNCFGIVLGLDWDCLGTFLELCWNCPETVLGPSWNCFGTVSGLSWDGPELSLDYIETVLGLSWYCVGTVLRLSWKCLGTPPGRPWYCLATARDCHGTVLGQPWDCLGNVTQQYGKNRQRCQQNKFTMLYRNYCYIFIEKFPSKILSVYNHYMCLENVTVFFSPCTPNFSFISRSVSLRKKKCPEKKLILQ